MPSSHKEVMPQKCVTCHMHKREKGKEKETDALLERGGHSFRSDDAVCLKCHEDSAALVEKWQKEITPLLEQLKALLDYAPDKKSELYKKALSNHDLVKADGGTGVHNPRYAKALLQYSISSLKTGF